MTLPSLGGVHGLSTAYHLAKAQAKVVLIEQSAIDHNLGSSHGATRITRGLYESKFYSDLFDLCDKDYWPEMEAQLKSKFVHAN